MKLNILFIISKVNYGGAGKMLCSLANHFSREGHNVTIYTYAGNTVYYDLHKNIHYKPEYKSYKSSISKKISPMFKVRKTIDEINPNLIISFLTNSNFLSIIGSAFKNIPVIVNERSDPYHEKGFLLSIMRFFYNFARKIVFQTEEAKQYYNNTIQKKSEIIPNPITINYQDRVPLNLRNNDIAFVGRFDINQKRQDLMIDAYSRVIKKHKNIRLVFYGDGADIYRIQEQVKSKGLSRNVIFAGKVKDIQKKLSKSRLFVLTSDFEGIPNALLEAMAVGLPVISTDCSPGGAKLLINHNENGLLIPPNNVEELSLSIMYLLDNPEIAEGLGRKAQYVNERFSFNKIMKYWDDMINNIELSCND